MTLDEFKRAIIAKTKSKKNMPDWYYERLSICNTCEFNSEIKETTIKDQLRGVHNLGATFCTICSCGIKDKCSDKKSFCPDKRWGEYVEIESKKQDLRQYKIENLSENTAKIDFEEKEGVYYMDYGIIKKGANTQVTFILDTLGKKITDLSTITSCGCTNITPKKEGNNYRMTVKYDSNRMGDINRSITISFLDPIQNKKLILVKLKGEVIQ